MWCIAEMRINGAALGEKHTSTCVPICVGHISLARQSKIGLDFAMFSKPFIHRKAANCQLDVMT